MGTTKERIKLLELGLGVVQNGLNRVEVVDMGEKLQHLEETLSGLSKVLLEN